MKHQHGGTLLGFIAGLILGLAVALGVAIYITKAPVPFLKNNTHSNDASDEADQKNKDWDPNAPLYGKKAAGKADGKDEDKPTAAPDTTAVVKPEPKPAVKPDAAAKVDPKSPDPIGDLAKSKLASSPAPAPASAPAAKPPETTKPADAFVYFVQAGAYRTTDEAEAQRAKLGLMGLDAKVNERDQGGRSIFRVRIGPLQTRDEADHVSKRLEDAHIDSALVRMQR